MTNTYPLSNTSPTVSDPTPVAVVIPLSIPSDTISADGLAVDKDQDHSKATQVNQAKEVLAGGHAMDKNQGHSKANQASQAEEVSAGGRAVDKDQDHSKANQAN